MITNTDIEVTEHSRELTKRVTDLEAAIRFALTEFKPEYRWGTVLVCLWYNFLKRPQVRITPLVEIHTENTLGDSFDPETVKLDLPDCLRQVNDRFNRERVNWGDLRVNIRKQSYREWSRSVNTFPTC